MLGTQLFEGANKPDPSRMLVAGNRDPGRHKPHGGLWTSTYDPRIGSNWIDWCIAEEFRGPNFSCWLLEPDPTARVLTIDGPADLAKFKPYLTEYSFSTSDRILDYEAIGRDYDALHYTVDGARLGHMSAFGFHPLCITLNSVDAESTFWFRWMFTGVAELGVLRFGELTVS